MTRPILSAISLCGLALLILLSPTPIRATGEAGKHAPGNAEADSKALEILAKAHTATRKLQVIRLVAEGTPEGFVTTFRPPVRGETVMSGWDAELEVPQRFLTRLEINPKAGARRSLTGGGNGELFFLIDHDEKKAFEDIDPAVMGSQGELLSSFGIVEILQNGYFERAQGAATVEYLGTEEVEGALCDKLRLVDPKLRGESVWSFSREDHLPRKRLQIYNFGPEREGSYTLVVSRLEINPESAPSLFDLDLPEGHQKIDDFAP